MSQKFSKKELERIDVLKKKSNWLWNIKGNYHSHIMILQ